MRAILIGCVIVLMAGTAFAEKPKARITGAEQEVGE